MDIHSSLTNYIQRLLERYEIKASVNISQDNQWVSLNNFNNYGYNFGFIFNIKTNLQKSLHDVRKLSQLKMDYQSDRYKISLIEAGIKEGDLVDIEVLVSEYLQDFLGKV